MLPRPRLLALFASLLAGVGCSDEAAPLPQLVLVVDTNAPLAAQVTAEPSLRSVAIDTLRIDVLTPTNTPVREFVLPEPTDWPLSFGVVPTEGDAVLLRLRAFAGRLAEPGLFEGVEVSDPYRPLTIDRLVELRRPVDEVVRVRILLDADCFGALAELGEVPTSCIDASRPRAPASEGLELVDDEPPTSVGGWAAVRVVPCPGEAVDDRVCIPGGVSTLGELELVGFGLGTEFMDPVPLRPVQLSPFWMDRLEFTVGRFRELVAAGQVTAPLPRSPDDNYPRCAWRGADDASRDAYPLNCVSRETAMEACALEGGRLPTEAEWEHAARGRGDGRRFPWGFAIPDCCIAAVQGLTCRNRGPQPAGSHPPAACDGVGDVSRDGVVDLGGSLSELFLDILRPYDEPCWSGPGALLDPLCDDPSTVLQGSRGGNWGSGSMIAAGALRRVDPSDAPETTGFRCVYEVAP